MMRKGSLTTQRKLQTMRIQHSQDSKKFKTKKNQNSLSPMQKQIILHNKQNIHPNINIQSHGKNAIEQFINNKLNIYSPAHDKQNHGLGAVCSSKSQYSEKGDKNRDPYYALKQQTINKRIQNNLQKNKTEYEGESCQRNKIDVNALRVFNRPKNISKQSQKQNGSNQKYNLISPKIEPKAKISPNPKNKAQKKKKKISQTPIFFKINNHDNLEKCQLLHVDQNTKNPITIQQTPKAAYLVSCKPASQIQFVCCEQCANKYSKLPYNILKVPLKEVATKQKYEKQRYLSYLYRHQDQLMKTKQGLEVCQNNYKKLCQHQYKIHRMHYNRLFEIIQSSMNQSQTLLAKYSNQGYEILKDKMKQTLKNIDQVKQEIQKIISVSKDKKKQKQIYNFDNINKIYQNLDTTISLPLFHIVTYDQQALDEFSQYFTQKFAIKIYSQENAIQKPSVSDECNQYNNIKQDMKNQKKLSQNNFLIIRNNAHQEQPSSTKNNLNFYCDEILGGSETTSNNFSFQLNDYNSSVKIKPNQCILELVEEEDVISPVFKAI